MAALDYTYRYQSLSQAAPERVHLATSDPLAHFFQGKLRAPAVAPTFC